MKRIPGRTRQRMVDSAVTLLRERGASGVSIDAVLAHSGAPRGSVYHHFPGGRNELVLSAVRQAGNHIGRQINRRPTVGEPHVVLDGFVDYWRRTLTDSGYRSGCPVVALAVDNRGELPEAADAVREIFWAWQEKLRELLIEAGLPTERSKRLAKVAVAAVEGAVVLCRAERSTEPLDVVIEELAPLFQ
ncbi:MAG: TetR family transcriptional regulator [Actinophytocola sp.]|nr:TetR family transcriptional regulator [Actinophytocola sp.]